MAFEKFDFSTLQGTLANSKELQKGGATYQTIQRLIDGANNFQTEAALTIDDIVSRLSGLGAVINVVEVDTGGGPVSLALSDIVNGMTIVKDISGNAGANNITLTGSVEGATDPVINTNFGFYHVYKGISDGLFHTW